ncbi:hypothetical protein CBR_g52695 [Chara braunii]|uniref:Protein kinase domain-containing protein n=1 Tax=Chara braunii TaxID=69332 RepID=A0A388MB28_CHABU|nr:hypothetical protein CBR_g52695 [Chara braunii]|eukprot:GBG91659.1 hypothetical protein CBR_g52695 [Chara braunii]
MPGMRCLTAVRNIVLLPPNNTEFFYILDESCWVGGDWSPSKGLLSFRQSSLDITVDEGDLISTWWPGRNGTGSRLVNTTCEDSACASSRDFVTGAAIFGTQLFLSGYHGATPAGSWLTALSAETGNRSSLPLMVDYAAAIAFDPSLKNLYVTDGRVPPRRIFSWPVTFHDDSRPLSYQTTAFSTVFEANDSDSLQSVYFGPYSFDPQGGACLYLVDRDGGAVWAFDPESKSVHTVAGRVSNALNVSFGRLYDLVVADDGQNLFVSEMDTGLVRRIELDSACGLGRRVTNVVEYHPRDGSGVCGLAIANCSEGYLLILGTSDGQAVHLRINRSALQSNKSLGGANHATPRDPLKVDSPIPVPPISSSSPREAFVFHNNRGKPGINGMNTPLALGIHVGLVLLVLVAIGGLAVFMRNRSRASNDGVPIHKVREFKWTDLVKATANFHESRRVGEPGGYGIVYRGTLEVKGEEGQGEVGGSRRHLAQQNSAVAKGTKNVKQIAVKVMDERAVVRRSGQPKEVVLKQFRTEVGTLSRLHHAHLCDLIGYCQANGKYMLVYPYIEGGSLYERLYGPHPSLQAAGEFASGAGEGAAAEVKGNGGPVDDRSAAVAPAVEEGQAWKAGEAEAGRSRGASLPGGGGGTGGGGGEVEIADVGRGGGGPGGGEERAGGGERGRGGGGGGGERGLGEERGGGGEIGLGGGGGGEARVAGVAPDRRRFPHLRLEERASIALQIAHALNYLHYGANPPVIHRDVKSPNVLLSRGSGPSGSAVKAYLADFGMAKVIEDVFRGDHRTAVMSSICGTNGYMPPEYLSGGISTRKHDVYAFGVLVLEMLTGQKAVIVDPRTRCVITLVKHKEEHLKPCNLCTLDLKEIVDPAFRDEMDVPARLEMTREMLRLVAECVNEHYEMRPTITTAAARIENIMQEAGMTPNAAGINAASPMR